MRLGLREYLKWLTSGEDHAAMLCRSGVPTWVVHAEQGDGGLTDTERRTLEACSTVELVTIPGKVFFLPNEVPGQIASVITGAVAAVNPRFQSRGPTPQSPGSAARRVRALAMVAR
jgi:pimeloyl-ACP methyl ester carboxylesterase